MAGFAVRSFLSKITDSRFSSWKEEDLLKGALQTYVKQGLKREEGMAKGFP